jgi:alkanesulfonate monooxygenase SsuD/methylene tetrahydromethanopterin reductase-like flavin-dependent oxidoreductase (luciferase family)
MERAQLRGKTGGNAMEFGYFTLSDNRYPNNPRAPEDFIKDIYAEALWAEKVGLHSAWIGEHHFNLLGVNASPLAILAQLAGATTRLRLAPAVTLLPVHHPLHVAEEWATLDLLSGGRVDFAAGRGYDRKEYEPFGAPFDYSAELFAEGLEIVWRAWTETGKWSHNGRFYDFKDVEVRPRPAQKPLRPYVACFSRPSMALAAQHDWNVIYAPFAAAMVYGSLADAVRVYRDTCEGQFKRPMRRAMCSYFVHIASTPEEEQYGKQALVRYFQDALIAAFPSAAGEKVPPTYKYFVDIVNILRDMRPEKLTDKSILCGSPQHIVDTLKQVEQAGIAEVILYFNYGQKPHALVKEQMERFMREVAPHFASTAPLRATG